MLTPIAEEKLGTFQDFEGWLDKKHLLDAEVLYRGHAKSTWELESTLYRHLLIKVDEMHPAMRFPVRKYTDLAKRLQAIVETHTDLHFDNTPGCDSFPIPTEPLSFRYAVYLRHHGFPSPLLDWSLSPYVAAYFAFIDAPNRIETKNGNGNDESHVAIYAMQPPTHPYKGRVAFAEVLPGSETGIRYWPNPVKGETRHYDQQSAYTTAIQQFGGPPGIDCYGSHQYILNHFPQDLARGVNRGAYDNTIDGTICWKILIPRHNRDSVLRRLDQMNINAYTLFRTEDALVTTYGLRELRHIP